MNARQVTTSWERAVLAIVMAVLLIAGVGGRSSSAQELTTLLAGTPAADQAPAFDYAIMIDISGSMHGEGTDPQASDIFGDVQTAVEHFIQQLPAGSTVVIMPFAEGVNPADVRQFTVTTAQSRAGAIAFVQSLPPNGNYGQYTSLYDSVEAGLDELKKMRTDDSRPHVQTELIYTDGLGNGPGDSSLADFLKKLDAARVDQPHLFVKYVSLGKAVPDKPALQQHGVQVVENTQDLINPEREVRVAPATVELGTIAGDGTVTTTISTSFSDQSVAGVMLHLAVVPGSLPAGLTMTISPADIGISTAPIPLQLTISGVASHIGWHDPKLKITSSDPDLLVAPETIVVQFTVAAPTPTPTATAMATATPLPTATATAAATATATPLPTATATPTATPLPTSTATPLPTSTPQPTSTPWPTSTPLPTPTVGFGIGQVPIDLGTVRINPDAPGSGSAEWTKPLGFTTGSRGVAVQASLLEPGTNPLPLAVPQNLYLRVAGSDQTQDRATLSSVGPAATLVARLDRKQLAHLGEGTHQFRAQLLLDPGSAVLTDAGAVRGADGRYTVPVTFTADVRRPPNFALYFGLLGAALLGTFVIWLMPRLPANARLEYGDNTFALRDEQPRRFPLVRLLGLGGKVKVGGPDDHVDLNLRDSAGTIGGGFPGLRKRAILRASREGIAVEREPLEEHATRTLHDSDRITIDGREVTYRQDGGSAEDDIDAGSSATDFEEEEEPPRRRGLLWRRRSDGDEDQEY